MNTEDMSGWWVVWRPPQGVRNGRHVRVAAFATKHMALEWVAMEPHRRKDDVLPIDKTPARKELGQ